MKINPNRTSTTDNIMPRSYSKKSLAHKLRRCDWCGVTGNGDEFCDVAEDGNKWACLDCDEEMINCAECGDCPTMFYKDAVEIDSNWYCKDCAKTKDPICSICEEEYTGLGNNAQPVNDGQCCDKCNFRTVLPARMIAKQSMRKIKSKKPKVLPKFKVLEAISQTPSTLYKIPDEWAVEDIVIRYGILYYKGEEVQVPSCEIEGQQKIAKIEITEDYPIDEYFDCE